MGKKKAGAPTLPRIRYMSCFDLTHAPVVTAARAKAAYRAREHVDPYLLI